MSVRRIFVSLSAVALLACPLLASAAMSIYLCIADAGFTGDVLAAGYVGCSGVTAVGQTGFVDGPAVIARDIKIDKIVDSMSNPLRAAMVSGTTLQQVKIDFVNTVGTGTPLEFQTLRLLGVRVSSLAMSADPSNPPPTETVSFMPAKIEFTNRKQQSNGTLGPPTYTCWDVVNQTATSAACP